MARMEKSALIEKVRNYFGEAPDDEQLTLIEDISDSMVESSGPDSEAIRKATEEVEKKWRKKYADRFLGKKPEEEEEEEEEEETPEEKIRVADLFKEEKKEEEV